MYVCMYVCVYITFIKHLKTPGIYVIPRITANIVLADKPFSGIPSHAAIVDFK